MVHLRVRQQVVDVAAVAERVLLQAVAAVQAQAVAAVEVAAVVPQLCLPLVRRDVEASW